MTPDGVRLLPHVSRPATADDALAPADDGARVSDAILTRVLERLGLSASPPLDLAGLTALYTAWSRSVPFDNVTKFIALHTGGGASLPGNHAESFFEHWLEHGAGGTCWPSSNALYALLRAVGFRARRVAGAMRDLGIVNHGSVKVALDGRDWLVDSSLLCNVPLPLGQGVYVHDDPVFAIEVESVDGTHLFWSSSPPHGEYMPCRLLVDPATHAQYLGSHEESRYRSPFNRRLYARRGGRGRYCVVSGNTRYWRTADGVTATTLSDDDLCASLHADIGLSRALITRWIAAGGLAAAAEPPSGPKPPPAAQPPSRRGR